VQLYGEPKQSLEHDQGQHEVAKILGWEWMMFLLE